MTTETWRNRLDFFLGRQKQVPQIQIHTDGVAKDETALAARNEAEIGRRAASKLTELKSALEEHDAYKNKRDSQKPGAPIEFSITNGYVRVSEADQTGLPLRQATVHLTTYDREGEIASMQFMHITARSNGESGRLHFSQNSSEAVNGLDATTGIDAMIARIRQK